MSWLNWLPIWLDARDTMWLQLGSNTHQISMPGYGRLFLACYAIGFVCLGCALILGTTRWVNSRDH